MEVVKEIIAYLYTHGPAIAAIVLMAIGVAEAVVRITPTKKDDGAVQRIGNWVRALFDKLSVLFPNLKKGGGAHPSKEATLIDKEPTNV